MSRKCIQPIRSEHGVSVSKYDCFHIGKLAVFTLLSQPGTILSVETNLLQGVLTKSFFLHERYIQDRFV